MIWGYPHFRKHPYGLLISLHTRHIQGPAMVDKIWVAVMARTPPSYRSSSLGKLPGWKFCGVCAAEFRPTTDKAGPQLTESIRIPLNLIRHSNWTGSKPTASQKPNFSHLLFDSICIYFFQHNFSVKPGFKVSTPRWRIFGAPSGPHELGRYLCSCASSR